MLLELTDEKILKPVKTRKLTFDQFRSKIKKINLPPEALVFTGEGKHPVLDFLYTEGLDITYREDWTYPPKIELEFGPPFVPQLKAMSFAALKKVVLALRVPKNIEFFAGEDRIPIVGMHVEEPNLIVELGN